MDINEVEDLKVYTEYLATQINQLVNYCDYMAEQFNEMESYVYYIEHFIKTKTDFDLNFVEYQKMTGEEKSKHLNGKKRIMKIEKFLKEEK